MTMKEIIEQATAEIFSQVVAIRNHIHANPELSFEEYKTADFICKQLTDWGISFERNVAGTGIVGLIKPLTTKAEKCIALRADMDALPIQEQNTVEYKSKNDGIMHACGHDVHTAILLGTAKILNDYRNELTCTVKLIFQQGEEKLPGGASLLIAEGVLEQPKVDEIYALHVFPELEVGKIGLRSGMYMASCDEIRMTVKGSGGHGAMPHQNIDPILIAAHLIVSLQQIVSRNCPPQIPCVLSFGRIEGLGATNVIPDFVKLEGTFRTMDEAWREKAHDTIKKQSEFLVQSMGGQIEVDIQNGYPYLENNPKLTEKAIKKSIDFFGKENVVDLPIRLTGEDFAYYSQKIPATFIRVGVRNEKKGIIHPVHNPQFNIDELALKIGMQTLLTQVLL